MFSSRRDWLRLWVCICGALTSLAPFAPLPHQMPDGHIDRDIQIVVWDRTATVDIRMAASDVTWIEIIRKAAERTKPLEPATPPAHLNGAERENADRANNEGVQTASLEMEPRSLEDDAVGARSGANGPAVQSQQAIGVTRDAVAIQDVPAAPYPTNEAEVAAWLLNDENRQLLERWIASRGTLEWCAHEVDLSMPPTSRPDSRHHWSITFQLTYRLPEGQNEGELDWGHDAFAEYPGKVRRALKTRGEALLDASDVSPLVVRAEFEQRTTDASLLERAERISAEVRIPEGE